MGPSVSARADPQRSGSPANAYGLGYSSLESAPADPAHFEGLLNQMRKAGKGQETARPVVPRELGSRDIDDALAYYTSEDAEPAALASIVALQQAYAHIGLRPASGSPRHAHEMNLPGSQPWPLARYPHLVMCVERVSRFSRNWSFPRIELVITPGGRHDEENPTEFRCRKKRWPS